VALFPLVLEILWESKHCKESEQVYATLEKDPGLRPLMITISTSDLPLFWLEAGVTVTSGDDVNDFGSEHLLSPARSC